MHTANFYRGDDSLFQAVIFSQSHTRADEIWEAVVGRNSLMPKGWTGIEFDIWLEHRNREHDQEARRQCIEGVGVYSPRFGWTILPLDYALIGISPPQSGE